ncbi:hypothetical protein ACOMHN_031244 [Nucella lapillus]
MSLLRRLLPVARCAGKLWTAPSRGIADIPIRKGPFWDLGWPYPYMRPWNDVWDEHQREYLRRMDKILRISPMDRMDDKEAAQKKGPQIKEYTGTDVVKMKMDKDNLLMEMEFDVSNYDPDDLYVNLTGDWVIINGQHSILADKFGYITRQFTRQIHLPEGLIKDSIAGRYTAQGNLLLSIKAEDEDAFSRVEALHKRESP